MYYVDV